MTVLLQDFRYSLRMFRKSPAFTAVAVLTLALGIGANTALFSVVNGVLLNPLPYPHPEQLIGLHAAKPNFAHGSISYPNLLDWQKQNHTFSGIAGSRSMVFSLTGSGQAEQVNGEFITSNYFSVLGVKPQIGRDFLPGEDRIGGAPICLVAGGLWQRRFASSPDLLNRTLTLNGVNYTVVGVIPANFRLPDSGTQTVDVYFPFGLWTNNLLMDRRAGLGIHGIGRMKPGVTFEQAKADMAAVSRDLQLTYPDADKETSADLIPLKQQMVGRVRPYLLTLLGAVGFVLLIACVNVANLLLSRSINRTREFAIRSALGASKARVIRQLLTESTLLALCGGTLGILFAAYGTKAALAVLPQALPRAENIGLDGHVLVFTVLLSLLSGILAGVVPATLRIELQAALKQGGRGSTGFRHVAQNSFVVTQMALAMVLLIGAGLMMRTLVFLWHVDPGFDPRNILTFGMSLPPAMNSAKADVVRQQYHAMEQKFVALPGIRDVSFLWGALPLADDDEISFWVEGHAKPASDSEMPYALNYVVSPSYFQAMSIPLQRGRLFTANDDEHAPRVVLIDTAFAHKFFPGEDPIGKRLNLPNGNRQVQIVGIVGHVKQWSIDPNTQISPLEEQFYFPWAQIHDEYTEAFGSGSFMMVRTDGRDPQVLDTLRAATRQISSEIVIANAESMTDIVADSIAARRFTMILLSIFAALALVLASIGIYGVISYTVGSRTQEIGIRMALGAERLDILRLVLANGGKLLLLGIVIGLVTAVGLTRVMVSQLSGVQPVDPLTFAAVTLLLSLVALLACLLPARRAAKVDPMVALRYE